MDKDKKTISTYCPFKVSQQNSSFAKKKKGNAE